MPQRGRRVRTEEPSPSDVFLWIAFCALGAASLSVFDRGGNSDRAMWFIAACAVIAFSSVLARQFFSEHEAEALPTSAKAWLGALGVLALFAVFSAIPIGLDAWLGLPGHARYGAVIESLSSPAIGATSLPVTLAPDNGFQSIVLLLSCLAIGLSAMALPEAMRFKLLVFLVAIALIQALLGVAQVAFRGASAFTLGYVGHVRAAGTFVNKNHLATLFVLLVPFAVLQASQAIANTSLRYDHRRLFFALWTVVTVSMVLACAATLSRSGIAAVMVVLIAAITVELSRAAKRGKNRRKALAAGGAAFVLLAIALGTSESFFAAVADSGASGSFSARLLMYEATLSGAIALFPLGSGIGSYAVAFPAFQPQSLPGFIEHAHNDVLQLLFEAGLFGVVALILIGVAAIRVATAWHRSSWHPTLGAYFLGALGFALHANLDFPARIPALAVIATILFSFACSFRPPKASLEQSDLSSSDTRGLARASATTLDQTHTIGTTKEASMRTDSIDTLESQVR